MKINFIICLVIALCSSSLMGCGYSEADMDSAKSDARSAAESETFSKVKKALDTCASVLEAKEKLKAMPITTKQEVKERDEAYSAYNWEKQKAAKLRYATELSSCKPVIKADTDLLPQPEPDQKKPERVYVAPNEKAGLQI